MHSNYIKPDAVAYFKASSYAPDLYGKASFYSNREGVYVVIRVSGLPKDNESEFFALHIHDGDSCDGEGFAGSGMHYNPEQTQHPQHAGDLTPLLSCNGEAYLSLLTNRFTVMDIIGKTIVIHNGFDDFTTQPSGNAGEKIACGVIKRY